LLKDKEIEIAALTGDSTVAKIVNSKKAKIVTDAIVFVTFCHLFYAAHRLRHAT